MIRAVHGLHGHLCMQNYMQNDIVTHRQAVVHRSSTVDAELHSHTNMHMSHITGTSPVDTRVAMCLSIRPFTVARHSLRMLAHDEVHRNSAVNKLPSGGNVQRNI